MARLRPMGSDQRGAAALETALLMVVLMGVLALTAPLVLIVREQLKLSRTAGRTARFASSAPDVTRHACAGARVSRRPTAAEVAAEGRCAHFGNEPADPGFVVEVAPDPHTALPGTEITVVVSNTVDLGPLGGLLGVLNVPDAYSQPTLTATVVSVEE